MGMAQRGEFIHGMDDAESLELPIAEQMRAYMQQKLPKIKYWSSGEADKNI